MKQGIKSEHWSDDNGAPAGGCSYGIGFVISWQNGPLGRDGNRREPNGAFVEDVLDAVRDRIAYYQASRFACEENALALRLIEEAAAALDSRTRRREAQATEGTHQGN